MRIWRVYFDLATCTAGLQQPMNRRQTRHMLRTDCNRVGPTHSAQSRKDAPRVVRPMDSQLFKRIRQFAVNRIRESVYLVNGFQFCTLQQQRSCSSFWRSLGTNKQGTFTSNWLWVKLLRISLTTRYTNIIMLMPVCIKYKNEIVWWINSSARVPDPNTTPLSNPHWCDWLWLFSSYSACCWHSIIVWTATGEYSIYSYRNAIIIYQSL